MIKSKTVEQRGISEISVSILTDTPLRAGFLKLIVTFMKRGSFVRVTTYAVSFEQHRGYSTEEGFPFEDFRRVEILDVPGDKPRLSDLRKAEAEMDYLGLYKAALGFYKSPESSICTSEVTACEAQS